jgi:hypothetical protein
MHWNPPCRAVLSLPERESCHSVYRDIPFTTLVAMNSNSIFADDTAPPEALVKAQYVWIAIIAWIVLAGPLFLAMPLNSDTALFDVQARTVLDGGVAYRDIVEPNLPGALWIHMAIRSAVGWSSEAMRVVDLLVFGSILWLWSATFRRNSSALPMFLLAGAFFYLTRNEWCHAQRDTWMLLPAGLAIALRFRRTPGQRILPAIMEGVCWGCAFWIKPHIAIPALAVILVDLRIQSPRAFVRDAAAVMLGGLLAAMPGIAWLIATGTWEHFWHMMLEWNFEYMAAGRARMSLERWLMMSRRFAPWPWIHLVAIPIAIAAIVRFRKTNGAIPIRRPALLSACYLGWLLQSVTLQHALDYIHVPAILLGLAVICSHSWQLRIVARRSVVVAFMVCGMLWTPFFRGQRLQQWPAAITHGSTVDVRAALAHGNLPDWKHLGQVIAFLNERGITNGDVTCMNVHSIHVYNETQTRPSTRYWSVSILQDLFPQRSATIATAVTESQHRYVVTETVEESLIQSAPQQPWMNEATPVFESGSYRVFRIVRDNTSLAQRNY